MGVIVIGMVAAAIALTAVPLIRRLVKRGADDWVSILVTVSGTFLGFSLALLASEHQGRSEMQARLIGLLVSAEAATEGARDHAEAVARLVNGHADGYGNPDSQEYVDALNSLVLPDVFSPILHSGELFLRLSPTMQRLVPVFAASSERDRTCIRGVGQVGRIPSFLELNLRVQRSCLNAEIDYQQGRLTTAQVEKAVSDTLKFYVWEVIFGDE